MTLRVSITVALLVGGLAAPCAAGDRVSRREKRRAARKARRKAEEEKPSITVSQKATLRLDIAALGHGGKIVSHKLAPPRLHEGLASRLRALQKVTEDKLIKRNLLAVTEAAERKARAEEEAWNRRRRFRKQRKADLTLFFDW